MTAKILFGVHNDNYDMDFYDDNSIRFTDRYLNVGEITIFDEEVVAVFMALLKRDGHLDTLLEIDAERLRKLGFKG